MKSSIFATTSILSKTLGSFLIGLMIISSGCSGTLFEGLTTDKVDIDQDTVFSSDLVVQGGTTVTIVSTEDSTNEIWFAPAGLTNASQFVAGSDMTKAVGDSTSITAPSVEGDYKLYIIDVLGNVSPASSATLTVDDTDPLGYNINDQDYINTANANSFSFAFTSAEVGTTYTYSIDDTNGGTAAITGTGTISTATDTVSGIDVSSLDDDTITLTVYLTDEAGNQGGDVTDISTKDTVAPTVAVDNLTTNDQTPELTGTVNDNSAAISVTVDGQTEAAINNANGTWTLADNTLSTIGAGTYNVSVTATDSAGNAGVDATNNELLIDIISPTVAITYNQSGDTVEPFNTGNLTITATYSETLASAPTISIDQQGTTDITNAAMTDAGAGVYTYVYAINTEGGPAYLDGEATVTLSGTTDAAGNSSAAPTNNTFEIDTSIPTVAITYNKGGDTTSPFNAGTVTITATYSENVTTVPNISIDQQGSTNISGVAMTGSAPGNLFTYTYTINADNGGTYVDGTATISLSDTFDSDSNQSTAPTNNTFTIDTTATITGTPDLVTASDTGASNSDEITNDTTPTFDISCETGSTVQLYDGASATGTSSVCAGSTATLTAGTLSATTHTITAKQTDVAGNESVSSTGLSVTIDTSTPSATGTPDLQAGSDSNISTDEITNDTTPTFDISCETGTTVQLYSDGTSTGSSGTCSGSTVTLTTGTLTAATYSITAKQTDTAGNESTASTGLSVTIDISANQTSTPDLADADDKGSSNSDNITNQTTLLTFSGTSENSAAIEIFNNTTSLDTTTADGSGNWTIDLSLSEGTYSINAKQTDVAGNTSSASSNLGVTIDTTIAVTGTPDLIDASDSGSSNSDEITNDTTPTFDISCETGTTVQLYSDGTLTGSSGTCAGSTVALTTGTLSAATHSITAKQTDTAGNESTASTGLSVTIDNAIAVTGTPDLIDASDSGSSNSDEITNDTTPTFDISCETGTTVQLYSDGTLTGSSGTCAGSTVALTTGTLSAATHSITAKQTDTAGNESSVSTGLSVTIDNTIAVTGTPDLTDASDTGTSNSDNITGDTTPEFNVSCETGTTVQLYEDGTSTGTSGTCSGSTVALTTGTLSSATYSITAKQVDTAGNESTASTGLSVTIDNDVPTISSAITMDTDSNGIIDHYKITFNEAVIDSTFPGYVENGTGTAQTDWLVAGRINIKLAHGTSAPESDTANDTVLYLVFDEGASVDTGTTPDLTTTATPDITDAFSNTMAQLATGDLAEYDGAAPVITSVSGITGSTALSINFSEAVDSDGGTCGGAIATGDLSYNNASGGDVTSISAMSDTDGCDNTISVTLNTALTSNDINVDKLSAVTDSILDVNNNAVATTESFVTGAISPYILSVTATGATTIRVTYSEDVDDATSGTGAAFLDNYTLTEDPVESGCSGTGTDSIALTGTVTKVSDSVYELSTDADQCSTTTYKVDVANVVDVDEGVQLVDPKFGTFIGNERLTISSASSLTTKTVLVVFNKDVESGTGVNGSEDTGNYTFTGTSNLGTIDSAVRDSSNHNQVTLTHSLDQTGGTYTVIGANNVNGDGFDDSGRQIKVDSVVEYLQEAPNDRVLWTGGGTAIETFEQGPIASDPFGDSSDFGYLASYNGKVYIGPNLNGNSANRFEADGSNPGSIDFTFTDTVDMDNSATDIVSIGHTGCDVDSNVSNDGCGPDNEDGRGVFSSGTIGSTDYIFFGGARTGEWFDYIYYTSDTDTTLDFKYIFFNNITGSATQGLSTIIIMNDRLYAGMAKKNYGGYNSPDFGKVNFSSGSSEGDCTPGADCDADHDDNGVRFFINCLPYFGGTDSNATQSYDNYAYYVGVDSTYVFRGRIYAANGGHNQVDHNGGIIRSDGTNYANPGTCEVDCSAVNDWVEITPRTDTLWHNSTTNNRFSIGLVAASDLIPQNKAVAGFSEFNTNLYMTRNTCTVANDNLIEEESSVSTISGCTDYSGDYTSNRRPQLWKCTPGTTGDADECDAGDWTVIDGNADGYTDMGDSTNHSITMIINNGSRLYVGFDNSSGIEIWRTKDGITDPTSEDDFEQVGDDGLGNASSMQEIYSTISIQQGTDYYIYISAGKDSEPVAVYRNKNN